MPFDLIDHTGDIGIVVRAATVEALFAESAGAMFSIVAEAPAPRPEGTETLEVRKEGLPDSLRDYLAELLYRFAVERKMYVSFRPGNGTVEAEWETYDPARHPLRTEIKAVTYHQLDVTREKDGWRARVIFDL